MQPLRAFLPIVAAALLHAGASGSGSDPAGGQPGKEPFSDRAPPFGHAFEPLSYAHSTEASRRFSSDSRALREFRGSLRPRRQNIWEGPWEYIAAALARPLNVLVMPGAIFGSLEAAGALQLDAPQADSKRQAHMLASRGAPRDVAPPYGRAFEPLDTEPGPRQETRTAVPLSLEMLIAFVWIGLMASSPAILRRLECEPVTKNHCVLGGAMFVVLLGGLLLSTNVLQFRSPRFEAARPLTVIECVYLMSQIVTTVGYGDIAPAEPGGQVLVGLVVLAAVLAIALLVSEGVSHILAAVGRYRKSLSSIADRALASEYDVSPGSSPQRLGTTDGGVLNSADIWVGPPKGDRLAKSLALFMSLALAWAVFFRVYPGEGKSRAEATYMSLVSLSTVGFGDFLPVTDAGRVFAAFWMPLGCAALLNAVGAFAEHVIERIEFGQYHAHDVWQPFTAFKKELGGSDPSEVEFMTFALQQRKLCDVEKIKALQRAFKAMSPSVRHGTIPLARFKRELGILG